MRTRNATAFTLIELLTAISVILLLVLITIPSYSVLQERVRIILCSSRLHSLAAAELTYVNDNRQFLTSARHWAGPYGPAPAGQPSNNYNDEADWYYEDSAPNRGGPPNGQLWPYIKSDKAYLCPSFKSVTALMSVNKPLRSYSQNINIWYKEVPQTTQDGTMITYSKQYKSMGMIANPKEMLLFGEENPFCITIRANSNSPLNDCVWRGSYTLSDGTTWGLNTLATFHSYTIWGGNAYVTWRPNGGGGASFSAGFCFGLGNYVALDGHAELLPWNYGAKAATPDVPDYTPLLFNPWDR